ncbi:carboxypeptidase regulatory-like domain-containing protein [Streptomyces sp. ME03-5709C]|nr:carboxypeptidase regulatory-like domain-containing protein [Streptomyces sp. ME03-5709C]
MTGLTVVGTAAALLFGLAAPAPAAARTTASPATADRAASPPSDRDEHARMERACGTPKKGEFTCFAMRRTDVTAAKGLQPAAQIPDGYGPADLRSAYNLPAGGGSGQTIAIVAAYDNPTAEADLAVYRQQYGLPACTTDNGCFRKIDQRGSTDYPAPDSRWAGEISLDLDMVSAIAPNANILLVEADDASVENLGSAVDTAVSLGAKYVSNSYGSDYRFGGGEDPGEIALDSHYNHPGVAVVAASGDYGYGVAYPAASPYVTSVGGTSLVRDPSSPRGWSETAWSGAGQGPGSGCSLYEPKPAFQKDTGCENRTVSDVSAVSDPATAVAVYQTYGGGGWSLYGGTSAAAPIIAGVYALAGTPAEGTYPNAYPYDASGAGIHDVVGGSNGSCTPAYLCEARTGYDGPTGLGTPDGLAAFRTGPHGELSGTVTDAVTGKPVAGATVTAGDHIARSADDGTYALRLPVGTHRVTVDAYGYATSGPGDLTVADGATLTRDYALTPVPSRTVSGKVRDASGHGWPLYAKITVEGVPGSPVWTDPATGKYQVSLPENHDYTLRVATAYAGYQTIGKAVSLGDADKTVNLDVPVDSWAATARGYSLHLTGTTESFDSTTTAPSGWKVVDADGTKGGWQFDDPGRLGNRTGGTGGFATVNSEAAGPGARQDSQLVTPAYDLSRGASPQLSFDTQYLYIGGETATVDASTDGGASWKTLTSFPDGVFYATKVEIPLTDYAGQTAVTFRFHFVGGYGVYWQVDNFFVGHREFAADPGALVVGQVTDANTGEGVVGASVTRRDASASGVTTVATPEDTALDDGFYSMFTPDLGSLEVTARKSYFTTAATTVTAVADKTVKASFKLKAGRLSVTPDSLSSQVAWGQKAAQRLTVRNTGSAPATLTLGERAGGFRIESANGAPLRRVQGTYSPLSSKAQAKAGKKVAEPAAGPSGSAWQTAPDLPLARMDNAVATHDGKIYSAFGFDGNTDVKDLYVLDPDPDSPNPGWTRLADAQDVREAPSAGFIDGKFYAVGGWGADGEPDAKLEIYDPAKNTWSTGAPTPAPRAGAGTAVLDGKLYVVGGCGRDACGTGSEVTVYDPRTDKWSSVAPYPEPISWNACAGLEGRLYCAGGVAADEVRHTYVYDPAGDSWAQLADLPVSLWASAYSSANGLLVVSGGTTGNHITNQAFALDPLTRTWATLPNTNVATYRGGAALGLYKVGGGKAQGVPTAAVEYLPGYNQADQGDVTWLSESARSVTLEPGTSSTITVTMDASVPEITQPGDYDAALAVGSDTPYAAPRVAVALRVEPPKTWGKITGVVRGQTNGTNSAPLAGATVQISSWTSSYSLRTAADGSYALWLDTRNNPLTVIAAKDGYQPTVTTAKLTKKGTVTVDFTLKKQ